MVAVMHTKPLPCSVHFMYSLWILDMGWISPIHQIQTQEIKHLNAMATGIQDTR